MRTTRDIEDDILQRAKAVAARTRTPFREVVNEALRAGLARVEKPSKRRPYHTEGYKMGLKPGLSLDNIQELISQVEGEVSR